MPSKLGKYRLLKTIGKGAFSAVKLAVDETTGKQYAIKIHKADLVDKTCIDTVVNEVKAIRQLSHPHIVPLLDFMEHGIVIKSNGDEYEVVLVVVQELATGGELFNYIANSGYLDEKIARYFFH